MREISSKAAKKPDRGGAPNALFVVASVEHSPDELRGVADEVFVTLPWGSLMRGIILGEPQVKISKHLAYLRARGLVEVARSGNWMVYSLPARPSRELQANLACLQDCAQEDAVFRRDLSRLKKRAPAFAATSPCGCS